MQAISLILPQGYYLLNMTLGRQCPSAQMCA
jgi:hypothetical protein